tara:strand:- start:2548 stop:2652 length:105 start_codon:yes stop_codon:yes gene_type:complete
MLAVREFVDKSGITIEEVKFTNPLESVMVLYRIE